MSSNNVGINGNGSVSSMPGGGINSLPGVNGLFTSNQALETPVVANSGGLMIQEFYNPGSANKDVSSVNSMTRKNMEKSKLI
jgi:hypothetical protein